MDTKTNDIKWHFEHGYPRARIGGKLKYQHVYVWEQLNGPLPKGWVVHHRNGVKTDNRDDNLLAMTRSDHMTIHALAKDPKELVALGAWGSKPRTAQHAANLLAARRARPKALPSLPATCSVCGVGFKVHWGAGKFCSDTCKQKLYRQNRKAARP